MIMYVFKIFVNKLFLKKFNIIFKENIKNNSFLIFI